MVWRRVMVRGGMVAVIGVLAVAVGPIAAPPASAGPIPEPGATVAASRPPGQPDLIETRWPKHPPWDACPRPVWPGATFSGEPGDSRRVLFIGDSLTRESRKPTTTLLTLNGWTPTYRCWGSKRLDWGIAQVERAKELGQLPDFVVLALGTNDISWETPQTTERRMRQLLDKVGTGRHVLWVDLHLTRSSWLNARAAWFNDLLHRLAKQYSTLTVVRWHDVARANGIHGLDGIHYRPQGYRLRAKTVAQWLDTVGDRA